jgi:methylmalonyl-CoA mutase N-terminal domain/subunit
MRWSPPRTRHLLGERWRSQLIIAKQWGPAVNEDPLQGSTIVEELTDLVEEAVPGRAGPNR